MAKRSYDKRPEDDIENRQHDPYAYGRKKLKVKGTMKKDYLRRRANDYKNYGIGFGISMTGLVDDKPATSKKKFSKKGWKS